MFLKYATDLIREGLKTKDESEDLPICILKLSGKQKPTKTAHSGDLLFFYFPTSIVINMSCFNTYLISFSNTKVCLVVLWFLFSPHLFSQITDTTHALNEVTIIETKQHLLQPSKKTIETDSVILARYNTSSLAELLSGQSTIHVKSYGNGNIATTSMRGGNASQTAVLWNGLNIQNAMLGQNDLSIIQGGLFESVSLEYGGGSAMWGSAAIGGSIRLQNKLAFDQGFKTKTLISAGSFETKKITSAVLLSYKKIASNTRIYYTESKNNYIYKDTTDKKDPEKQISHADYIMKGLLQELSFLPTQNQKINIRFWYNDANRNLPSYTADTSKQNQQDKNLKVMVDWNYNKRKLNSTIRAAYFNDKLNYNDSIANIYSKSIIHSFIAESDNIYTFGNHRINFGLNYTVYKSNLFDKTERKSSTGIHPHPQTAILLPWEFDTVIHHELDKTAAFGAYQLTLLDTKLNYNLAVRKEFTNQTIIPFTGNTGIHYQLFKHIALKINANRSYRQPTLNDLYWPQSGNPDLKPEDSYEADGGIEAKFSKNNFSFLVEGTYFNRHTTNWIIWLPAKNGNWMPKNIAEVYSRGTETKTELIYHEKDLRIKLSINTSYVLSTNEKSTGENDNSAGRQLIYTPRYTGQSTLVVNYKQFVILFNQTYTGYRFTSTDNTSWLNPYYLANMKLSYNYSFQTINMELFAGVNNLFNKNYLVVTNRPMPLRNFEIGLSLHYNKKRKAKTNHNIIPTP